MIIGEVKEFKTEGEYPLTVRFREMKADELAQFENERYELRVDKKGKMETINHSALVLAEWFDKLVIDLHGYYETGKGPKEFSLEKQIPQDALERMAKQMGIKQNGKALTMFDIIPAKLKRDFMSAAYDVDQVKKSEKLEAYGSVKKN